MRGIGRILAAALLCGACVETTGVQDKAWYLYSFEHGPADWTPARAGIQLEGDTIAWSIAPSTDRATLGGTSLRFHLGRSSDAATIWIERAFTLPPDGLYRIRIEYDLAVEATGAAGGSTLITGALPFRPIQAQDLAPLARGPIGTGGTGPAGYRWVKQEYAFDARAGADGKLYIVVGFRGAPEAPRSYYLDALEITISSG